MPNLTEKQIEQACRFLCKFRKVKADEVLASGFPRWKDFIGEIKERHRQLQIDKAIQHSLENL